MKRILVGLVMVGACEHGQSPSSENVRITRLDCTHDVGVLQFDASIQATLDDGQAVRVTFLPAVDGLQFSRTTAWDCAAWNEVTGADGCTRDAGQPEETQIVSVSEVNTVNVGTLPSTFEYTTVVSITSIEGTDVESVLLTDDC